jgi:hypothetical protein
MYKSREILYGPAFCVWPYLKKQKNDGRLQLDPGGMILVKDWV